MKKLLCNKKEKPDCDQLVPLEKDQKHVFTLMDSNSSILFLEKFGQHPVIISSINGKLRINYMPHQKYSDEEIEAEVSKILNEELDRIKKYGDI